MRESIEADEPRTLSSAEMLQNLERIFPRIWAALLDILPEHARPSAKKTGLFGRSIDETDLETSFSNTKTRLMVSCQAILESSFVAEERKSDALMETVLDVLLHEAKRYVARKAQDQTEYVQLGDVFKTEIRETIESDVIKLKKT